MSPSPGRARVEALALELRRQRRHVELAVAQVADGALDARPLAGGGEGGPTHSIAALLAHLAGNLASRFHAFPAGDGEQAFRDRDGEFEVHGLGRAELLRRWEAGWDALDAALARVADEDLGNPTRIRGVELTVEAALLRALGHVAYHAGQVVLLARAAAGDAWTSLSIPRGGSAAYASDPTRERSPDGASDERSC